MAWLTGFVVSFFKNLCDGLVQFGLIAGIIPYQGYRLTGPFSSAVFYVAHQVKEEVNLRVDVSYCTFTLQLTLSILLKCQRRVKPH